MTEAVGTGAFGWYIFVAKLLFYLKFSQQKASERRFLMHNKQKTLKMSAFVFFLVLYSRRFHADNDVYNYKYTFQLQLCILNIKKPVNPML